MIRPKKGVLFPEIGPVKIFLSLTRPHSRMCIRKHVSNLKQKTKKAKKKKKKKRRQKAKETKEEKTISVENLTGYDDTACKFALCTFNLLSRVINFFCCSYEFNVVYVQRDKYIVMLQQHMMYTTFKNKIILFSVLYLCGCKFVTIKTRTYGIAYNEGT